MSSNIFNTYDPNDIKKRFDNYMAASYYLKLAAESLQRKANLRLKSDSKNTSTYQQHINNINDFVKATQKLADLTKQFNTNFKAPPTLAPPTLTPPIR